MSTRSIREFKRLFYRLYFEDMTSQEVMALAMSIDQISSQMLQEADDTGTMKDLDAELNEFSREIRELVEVV